MPDDTDARKESREISYCATDFNEADPVTPQIKRSFDNLVIMSFYL